MSDLEVLNLIRSFAAAPDGCASPAEVLAWEDFFHIHDPKIRAVIRKYHDCWNAIDDIAQDVWCLLIRRLRKSRLDPALANPGAWVVGVAGRLSCRYARCRSRHHDEVMAPEIAAGLLDPDAGPATASERTQRRELVRAILEKFGASLPEHHRRIMLMYWLEERHLAEIATALGLSEDCVWGVIRRLSLKLPDLLRRSGLGAS